MNFVHLIINQFFHLWKILFSNRRYENRWVFRLRHPCALPFIKRNIFLRRWCQVIFILFFIRKIIYFIENHYHRFLMSIDFLQNLIHRTDMIFKTFVRNIHHMQQQICFTNLIKSRFKRLHQLSRKFSDKTNRICKKERQIPDNYFSHRSIQSSKKLIFRKNIRFRKSIHQRGFSHIGIPHQGNPYHLSAVVSLCSHLFIDGF